MRHLENYHAQKYVCEVWAIFAFKFIFFLSENI